MANLRIVQHQNNSTSNLLTSITSTVEKQQQQRRQRQSSYTLEEYNADQNTTTTTTTDIQTNPNRKSKRRRSSNRSNHNSQHRHALLRHDDEAINIDPRDEDHPSHSNQRNNATNRNRRKSTSSTLTLEKRNQLISSNPIPTIILYQSFSYIPLEHLDLWLWRNQMHDGLFYYLMQRKKSTYKMRQLDLTRSIGWTAKAMSCLLQKAMNLTALNTSYCSSVNDKALKVIGTFCPLLTALNISYCKQITGKGLLNVVEGVASRKLKSFHLNGINVATQSDGGRLFIAAVCIRCVGLQELCLSQAKGLRVGAFEAVLTSAGNVLEDAVATAKLPSIEILDVSELSGRNRQKGYNANNEQGGSKKFETKQEEGDKNDRDNGLGLSEADLSGFLLCIHAKIKNLNLNHNYRLTDDALRSICHKKTSWGYSSHRGSVNVHTLSLRACHLLSDVAMGWISTGCPNVEILGKHLFKERELIFFRFSLTTFFVFFFSSYFRFRILSIVDGLGSKSIE